MTGGATDGPSGLGAERGGVVVRSVARVSGVVTPAVWPLFDLQVETPRVELRYATDDDLQALAAFRDGRVVEVGEEPFDGDSSFYMRGPQARWKAITGEWGARSRTSAAWWHLAFAVRADGELVGQQNITAGEFPQVRTVSSFSFLAKPYRGQGLGKEMRAAIIHLAFHGLGALRAESDAFVDNLPSAGISTALGYEPNGTLVATRPSGPALMRRFLLTRERWGVRRRDDIQIDGLAASLPLLGLSETAEPEPGADAAVVEVSGVGEEESET